MVENDVCLKSKDGISRKVHNKLTSYYYLFIFIYLFSPPRKRSVLRPTLAMVVHLFDVCPVIETTELTRAANQ